jgi:hypothetical protein
MRGWKLPSMIVFAVISTFSCLAQSKDVVVQTLRLDGNPNIAQRCPSNDHMNVDWVDVQTLLVTYLLQPCHKGNEPRFGYTTVDLQGKTIAFADSDAGFMHVGPIGDILASNWKRNIQVVDSQFAVLKTIDCGGSACNEHLSADRRGFAVCGVPSKSDCRYFRGPSGDDAKPDDFPEGFPTLHLTQQTPSATSEPKRFAVDKDQVWFFDNKNHLFRTVAGGPATSLPSPAASIMKESCEAEVSEEGRRRVLVNCSGGIVLGSEGVLYMFERHVLYDASSGKVLLKLSSQGNVTMSPDGRRLAVVNPGLFGGHSSITLYYAP